MAFRANFWFVLQSKQLKPSSDEGINEFIIANFISVIISIICLSDEKCKIQIKPQFKTRILIGILLAFGARPAREFHRFTDLHNLSNNSHFTLATLPFYNLTSILKLEMLWTEKRI